MLKSLSPPAVAFGAWATMSQRNPGTQLALALALRRLALGGPSAVLLAAPHEAQPLLVHPAELPRPPRAGVPRVDLRLEPAVLGPRRQRALVQDRALRPVIEEDERAPADPVLANQLDVLAAAGKLLKGEAALVAPLKDDGTRLAPLPERKVLEPLELRVEQAEQAVRTRHPVHLAQPAELVTARKEANRGVLSWRGALRQDEAARVLRVEHLVGDEPLARAGDALEQLSGEAESDRVLLLEAARPRIEVLRRRGALYRHGSEDLVRTLVVGHNQLDDLAPDAGL
mmetsp:Transcript_6699/g.21384  ORF Transcript_6699/g.21384 Transcript_6699/m.21384 type:complete len:285 (+) Transcript_6699:15-869(+)